MEDKLPRATAEATAFLRPLRSCMPRSLIGTQLLILVPSALVLLVSFATPRVYLVLHSPSPDGSGSNTSAFSSALSLRFPTALAEDDTLTAGAEALEALLNPSLAAKSADPLSSAETLSSNASASALGPSAGPAEGEVVKAAVVDVDMQGLSQAEAQERRETEEMLIKQPTKCSCYRVKNDYCCIQVICLCGPLCWNGRELVAQVNHGSVNVECEEGHKAEEAAGEILVDGNVLIPLRCGELLEAEIAQPLQMALEEGGFHGLGRRDLGWLEDRRRGASWRLGMTFLRRLDVRAASDAAAFAGRLFSLLQVSNATAPALIKPELRHVMLPRDKFFRAVAEEHGPEGLLAHLLELLLRSALEPLGLGSGGFVLPEWHRLRVVQDEVPLDEEEVLGGGKKGSGVSIREHKHVEYERAWDSASEMQPLCFDRLLLPGVLKGLVFPNNTLQAEAFRAQALHFLSLQPEPLPTSAGKVRLLFARRADVSDRVFDGPSEQRLMALFKEAGFARVEVMDLNAATGGSPLALAQVVQMVQNADVIVGLHGSALVHAGAFLRPGTVLVEIVPHHLFFSDIQVLVAASGGLFIQHMMLPSPSPPSGPSASRASSGGSSGASEVIDFKEIDAEYAGHTVAHCMNSKLNFKCRQYFMRDRPIQLTSGDVADLNGLLGLAKHFAESSAERGLEEARAELARQALAVCKSGFMDLGFVTTDWLFDPAAKDPKCILKRTYWREG